MRPQIKQLIDLIDREGWKSHYGLLCASHDTANYHFRSKGLAFPRIFSTGVWLNDDLNEGFEWDEVTYFMETVRTRYVDEKVIQKAKIDEIITTFLASRKL